MKLFKSLLLSVLFVAALSFTGCNEEPTTSVTPETTPGLSKLTLPAGAVISSATFNINVGDPQNRNIDVHKVNVPWVEATETWNIFHNRPAPRYVAAPLGNIDVSVGVGYRSLDITALVQSWLADPTTNNGVILIQPDVAAGLVGYYSREWDGGVDAPYLEIIYTVGGGNPDTVKEPAFADTYLWSIAGENEIPRGSVPILYNANQVLNNENYIKYVLVQFDIESTPGGGGCTLTPGYWKTHSEFGPAPYDDTWAQLPNGASTTFFLSGKTYYQVFWTPPAGNAYYNLTFHYIAVELNFLNGADPSAAQAAFDAATTLFNTYTPAQIKALKGNNPVRQQFISLAAILGDYNEGLIGPGHCD